MNCAGFQCKLEQFYEGRLSASEKQSADAHLKVCSRCRQLVEICLGVTQVSYENSRDDLTRSILEHTSGSACSRARMNLCDYVDGTLDSRYAVLLAEHLSFCSPCSGLAARLSELGRILPELAEIDPGPGFVHATLQTMAAQPPRLAVSWGKFQDFWAQLLRRPRFGMEAAFAASLIFILLVGNPSSSMGSALFTRLGNTSTGTRESIRVAIKSIPRWTDGSTTAFQQAQNHASGLLSLTRRIPPTVGEFEKGVEQYTVSIVRFKNQLIEASRSLWSNVLDESYRIISPVKAQSGNSSAR